MASGSLERETSAASNHLHANGTNVLRRLCLVALVLLPLVSIRDNLSNGAQIEYDHAFLLLKQGNLISSQKEAELGYRQFENADARWADRFLLIESESLLYRGMYDPALRTLSAFRIASGSEETVQKLAIEAIALARQQQVPRAYQKLAQAEKICGIRDFASCGEAISARATLESKEGALTHARQDFLNALAFSRKHQDSWLQTRATLNLGYVALQVGHYDEAADWSKQALRNATAYGYENSAQTAAGNLGWAYYQVGDDERALEQFQYAEQHAEQLGNVRNQLKWLSTAGYIYRDNGGLERAAGSYRRALLLAKQIDSKEDIVNALEDLAQISELNGNLENARSYLDQASLMEANHPSANLLLTAGMLAVDQHRDSEAETDFRAVQNDQGSPMTIRLDAGSELARLLASHGDIGAAKSEYQSTLAAFESARAQLKKEESQLPFGTNASQIYDNYIQLLMNQGEIELALKTADQSRARTLEQGLDTAEGKGLFHSAALNPRQIARKTNAILLFYWLGANKSYLWAVTPDRVAAFTLPARSVIAAKTENYRKAILDLHDPQEARDQNGETLYNILIAPAKAFIHPEQQVIILAEAELNRLNFETLLAPGPERQSAQSSAGAPQTHYLIDDLTLVSAPSLAMLAASKPISDHAGKLLVLGNPVSPSDDFPALALGGFEMSNIESHFNQRQITSFAGRQATPAAYLSSNPSQYSYIHFVSHAIANQSDPLDSAIVLSRSAADENSFKLYARDIIQHPVDAQLVTISACNGSGLRSYAGEGLVGLSWAFLRAGSQRVIGALWEVSDNSTPRLMDTLYKDLANGDSPAAALRKAKLALLHSDSNYRLPFYWAPFQIYSRE